MIRIIVRNSIRRPAPREAANPGTPASDTSFSEHWLSRHGTGLPRGRDPIIAPAFRNPGPGGTESAPAGRGELPQYGERLAGPRGGRQCHGVLETQDRRRHGHRLCRRRHGLARHGEGFPRPRDPGKPTDFPEPRMARRGFGRGDRDTSYSNTEGGFTGTRFLGTRVHIAQPGSSIHEQQRESFAETGTRFLANRAHIAQLGSSIHEHPYHGKSFLLALRLLITCTPNTLIHLS